MTYKEARAYIASLETRGWRMGLDRMRELLRRIGNPHERNRVLHVAGTNGKGSVTAMIASVLRQAGYRTGSFFSPYVYDFRERIQVDGQMIPEEAVERLTERLIPESEELAATEFGGPTEFEFKTAMGFLHWQERRCDYVALEVGLGGRLDATNVVTPIVSVITEIGLDHQKYLGNTLSEIAREKAGIIKPGVPVISGVSSQEAQDVIRHCAAENNASLWQVGQEIMVSDTRENYEISTPLGVVRGLRTNLLGAFQTRNLAVAVGALKASEIPLPERAYREGLASVALPGRLEHMRCATCPVFFDGAHNAQSASAVALALSEMSFRRARVVYSAASGHDPTATVDALGPIAAQLYAAPMLHERGLTSGELESALGMGCYSDVASALKAALADCADGECVLVTGSFYLLSEAKAALMAMSR